VNTTCPGCGGAKSKRALLCAGCRRRANVVGAKVWTETAAPVSTAPRTPQQSRVYHGKLASLAQLQAVDLYEVKRQALHKASAMFGRPITSSTELTEVEMERLLEALDEQLEQLGYRNLAPAIPAPDVDHVYAGRGKRQTPR
jgi:hypothetical protein